MDNLQHYDPNASVSRFSNTVRFRSFNPEAESAAKANKIVSASTKSRRPASVSEIHEEGESPNQMIALQKKDTSLQLPTWTIAHPGVNDRAETPVSGMIMDDHNDPHDRSNDHLDEGDNDSDDGHSLHSLFSPIEQDRDSTDTDMSLESAFKGLDKRISEDEPTVLERSRAGDSQDRPIVLRDEGSTMDMSERTSPRSPERQQELHRGFDARIPISLSNPEKGGRDEGADQHEDGIDQAMSSQRSPPTQRRGASPPSSHSTKDRAEMPPKDEMATRGRGPSGRNGPNECGNDFEDDVGDGAKRFRSAKQSKVSTSVHENAALKRSISDRASTTSGNETGAFSAGDQETPIGVKNGELSSEKRRKLNEFRSDPSSKRRAKGSRSFASANSPPEDTSLGKLQKINVSQDGSVRGSEDDQGLEEKVWEYDELIGYREIDGREEVLVPWEPTWEPVGEYPREEVEKVKKKWKRTETVSRGAKMNKRKPNAQGWPYPSVIGGKVSRPFHVAGAVSCKASI